MIDDDKNILSDGFWRYICYLYRSTKNNDDDDDDYDNVNDDDVGCDVDADRCKYFMYT